MDQFWNDLSQQFFSYYDAVIALLPRLALAIVGMIAFYLISGKMRKMTRQRLQKRTDDPLLADFVARLAGYLPIVIGLLFVFKTIGLGGAATSLLAGAGVSAFIIGFAFKDIGENFLAGVLMAFQRPFRVGDTVQAAGVEGKITGLSLRDTQIKTFDGKDVYIPNGLILRQPIYNYTIDGYLRFQFEIGLEYDVNLSQAMAAIMEVMPSVFGVLTEEKPPSVVVGEVTGSIVALKVYFWINTLDPAVSGLQTKSDAIKAVLKRLKQEGYHLPADIREIKQWQAPSML